MTVREPDREPDIVTLNGTRIYFKTADELAADRVTVFPAGDPADRAEKGTWIKLRPADAVQLKAFLQGGPIGEHAHARVLAELDRALIGRDGLA